MVMLNCKRPTRLGGVRVNGKFNICAEIAKVVVSPLQTSVGNDIDLSAQTIDVEGDEVTIVWSATGGSIGDSNAAQTTYTCAEVGDQAITVTVSDDDFEYCMDSWSVRVTCVLGDGGDLCEGVTCDDQNECTTDACDPASGECVSEPVDDGTSCASGDGVCEAGECVPADLCEGVDCNDDNECTTDLCNPEDGQCSNDPVDDGTSCNGGAGMCVNGDCMDVDLCADVVCDDTGNDCTSAACDPATGLCEVSDVPNGTECAGGTVDLAINGGFETGNLDGWTQFCDGPNNGACAATMAQANTGLWSGNLIASVPAEGGAPSFPLIKNANIGIGTVTPGSTVTISFDLFGSLQGAGGVVFAEFFSELEAGGTSKSEILGGGPIFPTGQWTKYTYTTTTGPDVSGGVTVQLKVDCGATAGCTVDAYFDNVSVIFGSGGAGTCNAGVCEPSADCAVDADCPATGNECIDAVCNGGTCGTSNNTDTCDGGNGTCNAGVCEPNPECTVDADCPDTGNECIDAVCNAGACETSNNSNACEGGAGTCDAGNCVPNVDVLYEQNFELLTPGDPPQPVPNSLSDDGWKVGANVFGPDGTTFLYNYFAFPAPNGGPAFSAVAVGEGGPAQGAQQLSIYNDYNNADHAAGNIIEAVVFRERTIVAGDVGTTIVFTFDAKKGNIVPPTTAAAFVKTIAGSNTTNNIAIDTTNLPDTWDTFTISLPIIPDLVGQVLQIGFQSRATNYDSSGIFYDNLLLAAE